MNDQVSRLLSREPWPTRAVFGAAAFCAWAVAVPLRAEVFSLHQSTISGDVVCPGPEDTLVVEGRNTVDRRLGRVVIACPTITFSPGATIETTPPLRLSATLALGGSVDIRRGTAPPGRQATPRPRDAAVEGRTGREGAQGSSGSRCTQVFAGHRSSPGGRGPDGGSGAQGAAGRAGGRGHAGLNGPDIDIVAADLVAGTTISVQSRGEDGQAGQPGGVGQGGADGGTGGRGGRGGSGGVCFHPSGGGSGGNGGAGGPGGPGGRGGNGGNGGAGGNVAILLASGATHSWSSLLIDNRGGQPGAMGVGGTGGNGGAGGAAGAGGAGGTGGLMGGDAHGTLAVPNGLAGGSGVAGARGQDGSAGPLGSPGAYGALGRATWRVAE